MVLANVATAKELAHRGVPTLYRVHGEPDEKKVDTLIQTLRAIGVQAEMPGGDHARATCRRSRRA